MRMEAISVKMHLICTQCLNCPLKHQQQPQTASSFIRYRISLTLTVCLVTQILRKPDGGSRGFGFVTYKDEMSVEKCLVMQHSLNGRTVELKRAIRKEDMAPGSTGTTYAGSSGGGSGGPVRGGKQPDWTCPDCRNKNFGWREVCNRCGVRLCCMRTEIAHDR